MCADLAGRLIGAVDVCHQVQSLTVCIDVFHQLHALVGFTVKEVHFDPFDPELCPAIQTLCTFFRRIEIIDMYPCNQADPFFICILYHVINPIVFAIVASAVALLRTRLPAFVHNEILPSHFGSKVDVLFDLFRIGLHACTADQPSPGANARLSPGVIPLCWIRTQVFRHCIFVDVPQRANNGKPPRECKGSLNNGIFTLKRRCGDL